MSELIEPLNDLSEIFLIIPSYSAVRRAEKWVSLKFNTSLSNAVCGVLYQSNHQQHKMQEKNQNNDLLKQYT